MKCPNPSDLGVSANSDGASRVTLNSVSDTDSGKAPLGALHSDSGFDIVRLECSHVRCGLLCDVAILAARAARDRRCRSGKHALPEKGRCLACKAENATPRTEAQRAARRAKGYGNQRRS